MICTGKYIYFNYCQLSLFFFILNFLLSFHCNVCNKKIKCDHMGKHDVIKHSRTQSHKDQAKSFLMQSRLQLSHPESSESLKKLTDELKMVVLTDTSNISMVFHDKLSPAIRSAFSDSVVASNYHSASTKATCMLNLAVVPL